MSESRFVVSSVTGCAIRPAATNAGSGRSVPTSYYVLDRAYCHRVVAAFDAAGGYNRGDSWRRAQAEEKAAELNVWDATL